MDATPTDKKAQRHTEIERLRARNPRITNKELAAKLGVDPKTIQRDLAEMKSENKLLKAEIPANEYMRDELFERITSTFDAINDTVLDAKRMAAVLEDQIAQARNASEPCDCCGRKGWQVNALEFQSYAKILDTVKATLELRAKLLQEINDSPQTTILQIDSDVTLIMRHMNNLLSLGRQIVKELRLEYPELEQVLGERYEEFVERIEGVGPEMARTMYGELVGHSQRRARRMPEFIEVIDAEPRSDRLLGMGGEE